MRRGNLLSLFLLASVAALQGCSSTLYMTEAEQRSCIRCLRSQDTLRSRLLGMTVSVSRSPIQKDALSDVYDKYIEKKLKAHEHEWIVSFIRRDRVDALGRSHNDSIPGVIHHRTRFALRIVRDLAEEDLKLAREIYGAILTDYHSAHKGRTKRLTALSSAARESRTYGDPADYWRRWWRKNRRSYQGKKGRRGRYPRKVVRGEWRPDALRPGATRPEIPTEAEGPSSSGGYRLLR